MVWVRSQVRDVTSGSVCAREGRVARARREVVQDGPFEGEQRKVTVPSFEKRMSVEGNS